METKPTEKKSSAWKFFSDDADVDTKTDAKNSWEGKWWDAGGPEFTIVFWLMIAAFWVALFLSRSLPFVDYPQHLMLGGLLRKALIPSTPEHALFATNLFSYNALSQIGIALFNVILPIDIAGKMVLGVYLVLMASGILALLSATRRPRHRAFLIAPVLFGYNMAWGFLNFSMAIAIGLHVVARIIRQSESENTLESWVMSRFAKRAPKRVESKDGDATDENAPEPTSQKAPEAPKKRVWKQIVANEGITALIAFLVIWTHLYGAMLIYMWLLVVLLVKLQTDDAPLWPRIRRVFFQGAPLLPALLVCYVMYRQMMATDAQNWEYAQYNGNDISGWDKLFNFLAKLTGLQGNALAGTTIVGGTIDALTGWIPLAGLQWGKLPVDAMFASMAITLMILIAACRDKDDPPSRQAPYLFLVSVVTYFVMPHTFWATFFIYERIPLLIFIALLLWIPRTTPKLEFAAAIMSMVIGLASSATFFQFMRAISTDNTDFDAIVDDAPPNRRVCGLIYYPKNESTAQYNLVHASTYYVARKGGEAAFSFTRTMSLPVHYRLEKMPPKIPVNWEWEPWTYDLDLDYARYFDLVLVKTQNPVDPTIDVFRERSSQVKLLSRHGHWWLYDTKDTPRSVPGAEKSDDEPPSSNEP